MSVADILQQMAQNAGRAQLQRGAILGDVVAEASKLPAGILADRERQQLIDEQRARQQAQDARQASADTRAAAAYADEQRKTFVAHEIIKAYTGGTPNDPSSNNLDAGIAKARELGAEDQIQGLRELHRKELDEANPKPLIMKPGDIGFDPRTHLPIPGLSAPAAPTTAGNEAAIRDLYAKREGGQTLTPAEAAQIKGYEAEKGANDAPVTVKTVENGKMVEKVMTRAQALAAGSFASQPPASVQIQNMPPPPAQAPSKAEIAMANYMVATPSPRTFATPAGKAMMDRILTVNPEFDASLYSVRAPTRKAFTTGTQGQQLTAMNTAVEHLDQLQRAADALDNGTLVPGNALMQSLKETFGSNAPTNYETIKNMVDKEVEAVANKGVPTVSGTAEQKALAGKKAAPGQIQGYINTLIPLMGSKVNALHFQYKQAMGANDPFDPLTPEAKAILAKRGFDPSAGPSSTGTIRARDPQGVLHEAPAGTALPAGWKLER